MAGRQNMGDIKILNYEVIYKLYAFTLFNISALLLGVTNAFQLAILKQS